MKYRPTTTEIEECTFLSTRQSTGPARRSWFVLLRGHCHDARTFSEQGFMD
jgi:hypothetical protein